MGIRPFSDRGPKRLLWAGSPAARVKITTKRIQNRVQLLKDDGQSYLPSNKKFSFLGMENTK
jgi:hypothetical protein